MGCGQSVPTSNPNLVGLWISDDATQRENLMHNFEWECRKKSYAVSKIKRTSYYKPCSGAVLEIEASGYLRYLEMEGLVAKNAYSGPITNWDGPDGVWTGCCAGYCCRKGCAHFDAAIPPTKKGDSMIIHVNGRNFVKEGKEKFEEEQKKINVGAAMGDLAATFVM